MGSARDCWQAMAEYLLESCQVEKPWNFEILTNLDSYASARSGYLAEHVWWVLMELPKVWLVYYHKRLI